MYTPVLIQHPKQKLRYMQSSCHAQGHDIRDTLYQIITTLNKVTSISIPLLAKCFFSAFYLTMVPTSKGGQHSSVGTATFYRLVHPGFEHSGGTIFQTHLGQPQGPPSLLYNGYWVSGVKRHHPTSSSTRSSTAVPRPPFCACLACHGTACSFFTN